MWDGLDGVDLREIFADAPDLALDLLMIFGDEDVAFFQLALRSAEVILRFSLGLGAFVHGLTSGLKTGLEFSTSCRGCSELLSFRTYGALD